MHKPIIISLVLLSLTVSYVAGQSLSEIATKERERRAQTSERVTVVDENALDGFDGADGRGIVGDEDGDASADASAAESPDNTVRVEIVVRQEGDDVEDRNDHVKRTARELRAERAACADRLADAHSELKKQRALLRQGATIWGETPPTSTTGIVYLPDGSTHVVDGAHVTTHYKQGRVGCVMATRNWKRYSRAAEVCEDIQRRIDALRAEIGAGCS